MQTKADFNFPSLSQVLFCAKLFKYKVFYAADRSNCYLVTKASAGVFLPPLHVIFAAFKAVARLGSATSSAIYVDTFLNKVKKSPYIT